MIIDGIKYKLIEKMGFQHSAGVYAALVIGPDGQERIAQRRPGGQWRFRTPIERIAPLIEWLQKEAAKSQQRRLGESDERPA